MCCSCFLQFTCLYFCLDLPLPYVDYFLPSPWRLFWTISELSLRGQARPQHLRSPSRIPRLTAACVFRYMLGTLGLLTLGYWLYLCDQAFDLGLPDPMTVWPEPWYSWEPCSSGRMEVQIIWFHHVVKGMIARNLYVFLHAYIHSFNKYLLQ